eukprot:SAG31_NODE_23704_length_498_cov_0.909774_2_plen_37_part_01
MRQVLIATRTVEAELQPGSSHLVRWHRTIRIADRCRV